MCAVNSSAYRGTSSTGSCRTQDWRPSGGVAAIDSDEHPAYAQAFRRLRNRRIQHRTTSSRAPRCARNPLFPVNLADLLLRHCGANHKRETIAFSKRRQSAAYRLARG